MSSPQSLLDVSLWKAYHDGSESETLRTYLEQGANPNYCGPGTKSSLKVSLLHEAAGNGRDVIVEILLKHGANVNIKDLYERTPLHYGAENGHTEVVHVLLKHDADPTATDEHGVQPLHVAKRKDIVVALVKDDRVNVNSIDKKGRTALHYAIENKHNDKDDIVKTLLDHKADPNIKNKTDDQATPLLQAVMDGHNEALKLLIKAGGRIIDDVLYFGGRSTLLHIAVYKKNYDIVKTLIDNGHPVDVKDGGGWAAFDGAVVLKSPSVDIVRIMLENGADPNYKVDGKCSLHHVIDCEYSFERAEVVLLLLEKGNVDINAIDNNGMTPLHHAIRRGHWDIIQLLIYLDADITIADNVGRTPVDEMNGMILHQMKMNTKHKSQLINQLHLITQLREKKGEQQQVQREIPQENCQHQQEIQLLHSQVRKKDQQIQDKDHQIDDYQSKEIIVNSQLQAAVTLYLESQQAKATLEEQYEQLQTKLKDEEESTARLMKQNEVETEAVLSEKDKVIQSLEDKLDEEKREEKILREKLRTELKQEKKIVAKLIKEKMQLKSSFKEKDEIVNKLQLQLHSHDTSQEKKVEIGVQFDYLIPQFDILHDSGVHIAGQKLFHIQGNSPHSFNWEQYGFRLHSPQGILQSNTDTCQVAVTPLVSGPFSLPKGTVLVSAVYAISVSSKPLLKPLEIQLEHCVDLRTSGETDCLKFVLAPLQSNPPYQLQVVEGGVFSVGNRYGTISRKEFCFMAIGAKMNEGGGGEEDSSSSSEGGEPTPSDKSEGSSDGEDEEVKEQQEQIVTSSTDAELPKDVVISDVQYLSKVTEEGTQTEPTENGSEEGGLSPVSILYNGMMYHEQKGTGYWRATYTVVKDLEVFKEYLKEEHSHAERDDNFIFQFNQPNGVLQLTKDTTDQLGWKVDPHNEPMEIYQSAVDKFVKDPTCSSISYSIYAHANVPEAEPLHCPIQLLGVIPYRVIYINRPLPLLAQPITTGSSILTTDSTVTNSSGHQSGGSFRGDIAHNVICSNIGLIKKSINLHSLADKLLENRIINEQEKKEVTDRHCGLTADERMDNLLNIVTESIEDGEDFKLFLDILRQENTRRADKLVAKLLECYRNY